MAEPLVTPAPPDGPSEDDVVGRWAAESSARRMFWISLAAFVAGEGFIGFLTILFNGFPLDVELSRSLLSAILCASNALAGLALIKRHWLEAYARAAVVGSGVAFP